MNRRVWVLGSSNVDSTYKVQKIPAKGYTVEAESCMRATGGKGANQAVAAAHWGTDTSFIGAVGNDPDGKILMEVFQAYQINSEYVTVVDGTASGNAIVFVDSWGANAITVFPGANRHVEKNTSVPIVKGDILTAQFEVNMDAVEFYFELAKKGGAFTVLNPSPIKPLSKMLVKNTDLIVLNETEACEICGNEVDSVDEALLSAEKILKTGVGAVVITLGKQGAVVADHQGFRHIHGYRVEVVDTQGAGDVFLGTLVAGLASGKSLYEAAEFANRAASVSVTKSGSTQISMPSMEEIGTLDTKD